MAGKRKKNPGIRNRDHQRGARRVRRVQMIKRKQRMPLRNGDGFIDPHKGDRWGDSIEEEESRKEIKMNKGGATNRRKRSAMTGWGY